MSPEPSDSTTATPAADAGGPADEAALAVLEAGEVCFVDGDYECARLKFEAATAAEGAPTRARALWRLAWAEYHTDRGTAAIASLERALETLDPPTDAEQRALRDQIVYDLPNIFVLAGDPARAAELFGRVLRADEVVPELEVLAENYAAMGYDAKSRIVQESLRQLRANP